MHCDKTGYYKKKKRFSRDPKLKTAPVGFTQYWTNGLMWSHQFKVEPPTDKMRRHNKV